MADFAQAGADHEHRFRPMINVKTERPPCKTASLPSLCFIGRRNSKRWIRSIRSRQRKNLVMKLVIIEKLPITVIDFKNVSAQAATDRVGYQHVVALDAFLFRWEFDANEHRLPRLMVYTKSISQRQCRHDAGKLPVDRCLQA